MLTEGIIVKVNSDTFTVRGNDYSIDCKSRGKFRNEKIKPVVGDKVLIDKDKRVVEKLLDRKNYLLRPPVANIDVALIVTSVVEPDLSLSLLDKLICIITLNNIEPVIVFTKIDLSDKLSLKSLKKLTKYYKKIGINVFNNKQINKLKRYLNHKIVTVCGQTGAGKSTLINKIDKNLNLETKEISESLGRGVHTTRVVELFQIKDFYIVDTPGFSSIDIDVYTKEDIKKSFIEFKNIDCKFKNCLHDKDLDCGIKEAVFKGNILKSRYDNYLRFIKEAKK